MIWTKDVDLTDYYRDELNYLWADVLNLALATHHNTKLQTYARAFDRSKIDDITERIPDGMIALVRRCILVVSNSSCLKQEQQLALFRIAQVKLMGINPRFDMLIEQCELWRHADIKRV